MSFLLCHDCFTWVEPEDHRCPECRRMMDLSEADPPLAALREVLGELMTRLGEVQMTRRLLPECGTLYATTQGLFFVPHEQEPEVQTSERPGPSLMWSLGAMLWSPLLLFSPGLWSGPWPKSSVRLLRPRYLTEADSPRLPELLMDNPGAFFLSRRLIRAVYRKRFRWIIDRNPAGTIRLVVLDAPRQFAQRLTRLLEFPEWQTIEQSPQHVRG